MVNGIVEIQEVIITVIILNTMTPALIGRREQKGKEKMEKIPTLFKRIFVENRLVDTIPVVNNGLEWVLEGKGKATIKFDGSCCAIINGKLYKRYDAKKGKKPPEGAISCCEPDPVTGHWPHWVRCNPKDPADKWFFEAVKNTAALETNATYEAVGKHFNGNPYQEGFDYLVKHGSISVHVERTYEGIRDYLKNNHVEGLVFWKDGKPQCKIKRKDFGFEWPVKNIKQD